MWEKLNKVGIANVIAIVIVTVCSYIALTNPDKQDKFMDMGFGAVIGWAYMRSQSNKNQNQNQ